MAHKVGPHVTEYDTFLGRYFRINLTDVQLFPRSVAAVTSAPICRIQIYGV